MSEDIELMSLEHINNVERYVVVKGLKDIGHDRTKRLCATARAAHKLKQRNEEMREALEFVLNWNEGSPPLGDEPWLEMVETVRVALLSESD